MYIAHPRPAEPDMKVAITGAARPQVKLGFRVVWGLGFMEFQGLEGLKGLEGFSGSGFTGFRVHAGVHVHGDMSGAHSRELHRKFLEQLAARLLSQPKTITK